jgi:hypothetical protein
MDDLIKNKPKIEDRVRGILTRFPYTRGDDVLLYRKYLLLYSDVRLTASEFKKFLMIPSPESISRARRKIQKPTSEHPELMPSERVKRKRTKIEGLDREYYAEQTHIDLWAGMRE